MNNQVFRDLSFNFQTRTFSPDTRRDYDVPLPSTSKGDIWAVYARDKFELGKKLFMELGLRYEHQKSNDDISRTAVDVGTVSPRFQATYDLTGAGKSLIVGTYGRFYQFVLQSFSDGFGQNAQQATYNNFVWNGSAYVFSEPRRGRRRRRVDPDQPRPHLHDEATLGYRQQIGNTMGVR